MNEKAFERFVAERVAGAVVTTSSGPAIERTISRASRTRQRPRWLALIEEPPMRIASRLAVGSPTARVAALLAATLLLAMVGVGAVVAGGTTLLSGAGPIVVAQDGSGDFSTITEAIDAAADGDTILVRPGRYTEAVTIAKDITLAGDGERDEVVIENPPDGPMADREILREFSTGPPPHFTLLVEDAVATISGLTVSGPMTGGITAIVIGGEPRLEDISVVLEGPAGTWEAWAALYIVGDSQAVISRSSFDGFTSVGAGASATLDRTVHTGRVSIDGPGETHLRGNTFRANASTGNGGVDINNGAVVHVEQAVFEVDASGACLEGDVTIHDYVVGGRGIEVLGDGTMATISGNSFSTSCAGIIVREEAAATIDRSNIITGSNVGLDVRSSSVTVEGNDITGNVVAISIAGDATPTITGNTLCDNETDLRVEEGNPTTLEGNEVCPESASPETAE